MHLSYGRNKAGNELVCSCGFIVLHPGREGAKRQQTWFATVVCAIAVIPGFILGAIAKIFMVLFGGWADDSDFLFMHALFGLDKPGMIYNWVFVHAIPSGVQAGIAGYFAVWATEKIAKGANYGLAAMITGGLYTGMVVCLFILTTAAVGVTSDILLSVCQCVGLWVGLASAAATLPTRTALSPVGPTHT